MEWIVENNYTGFNGAVSTFGGIVDSIKGTPSPAPPPPSSRQSASGCPA